MSRTKSEYQKQKKIWYKRLKASGFNDIEKNEYDLKTNSAIRKRDTSKARIEALHMYYSMATDFLNDYKFNSKLDQIVWEYHANGLSVRDVVKLLKSVRIKTNRQYVWLIVSRLRTIMKKMYMK